MGNTITQRAPKGQKFLITKNFCLFGALLLIILMVLCQLLLQYLAEWNHHEVALVHVRMRQDEVGLVDM